MKAHGERPEEEKGQSVLFCGGQTAGSVSIQ